MLLSASKDPSSATGGWQQEPSPHWIMDSTNEFGMEAATTPLTQKQVIRLADAKLRPPVFSIKSGWSLNQICSDQSTSTAASSDMVSSQ